METFILKFTCRRVSGQFLSIAVRMGFTKDNFLEISQQFQRYIFQNIFDRLHHQISLYDTDKWSFSAEVIITQKTVTCLKSTIETLAIDVVPVFLLLNLSKYLFDGQTTTFTLRQPSLLKLRVILPNCSWSHFLA